MVSRESGQRVKTLTTLTVRIVTAHPKAMPHLLMGPNSLRRLTYSGKVIESE